MSDPTAAVLRIYQNIQTLLTQGQFPGGAAPALTEAQDFLARIIRELEESNGKAGSETGSGVQPEEDAGRVGREQAGDRRKQGRKPKGKRA